MYSGQVNHTWFGGGHRLRLRQPTSLVPPSLPPIFPSFCNGHRPLQVFPTLPPYIILHFRYPAVGACHVSNSRSLPVEGNIVVHYLQPRTIEPPLFFSLFLCVICCAHSSPRRFRFRSSPPAIVSPLLRVPRTHLHSAGAIQPLYYYVSRSCVRGLIDEQVEAYSLADSGVG